MLDDFTQSSKGDRALRPKGLKNSLKESSALLNQDVLIVYLLTCSFISVPFVQ